MEENKQVTAEEIYRKHEHAASTDMDYPMENGFSFMKNAMEEYAALKTQQLRDQLSTVSILKEKMASTFEKTEGVLIKGGRKLTGEEVANEIRQESELGIDFIIMMVNLAIDLTMRDKVNQDPARIQQLTAENERLREVQRWIPVTERLPEDGKVYDIVIYWPVSAIQEKREGYIFKEKSFPEERPMFQEASCFGMGLYELTFFLSENLVTHYREWMPLPNKPELT